MKLAKYLADYLAEGIDRLHKAGMPMDFNSEGLEPVIQQGLEAFVSAENVSVRVHNNVYTVTEVID